MLGRSVRARGVIVFRRPCCPSCCNDGDRSAVRVMAGESCCLFCLYVWSGSLYCSTCCHIFHIEYFEYFGPELHLLRARMFVFCCCRISIFTRKKNEVEWSDGILVL
ncbi:unnamed protein product, partial [Sphacelaria rigidula]